VSKFSIGDRVRIVWSLDPEWGQPGEIGTIVDIEEGEEGDLHEVTGVGALYPDGEGWFHEASALALASDPTYTRDDLIRVVLGQQWAVAIALYDHRGNNKKHSIPHYLMGDMGGDWMKGAAEDLADLPCAVDVVDGKEGA
jgi:hypothetical protein